MRSKLAMQICLFVGLLFSLAGFTELQANPMGPKLISLTAQILESAEELAHEAGGEEVESPIRSLDPTVDRSHMLDWYRFKQLPPFEGPTYFGKDDDHIIYAGNSRFSIDAEPEIPELLRSSSGFDDNGEFSAGYWIVYFPDGVTPELQARLDDLTGATVGPDGRRLARWYIPNRSHIVWIDRAEEFEALRDWREVGGLTPYHPAYKLSPAIGFEPLTSPSRVGRERYILNVDLIPGHSSTLVKGALVEKEIEVLSQVYIPGLKTYDVHYLIVAALPEQVVEVATVEGVRFIQETGDGLRMYDLSGGGKLQNRSLSVDDQADSPIVNATDFPIWLTHNIQGQGQLIGVVDSSLDWNNAGSTGCANGSPDTLINNYGFADPVSPRIAIGTGGVSLKVPRADELGGATLLGVAGNEHGCAVAGAAAADFYGNDATKFWEHDVDVWETWAPSNFSGLIGPGIAHEAQIFFTPVMDSADAFQWQSFGEFPTHMGTTLTNMANAGVCATSHSVGLAEASNTYTETTVVHDTKGFDHLGMLQCMAAGNSGAVANALTSQSVAKNVFAVGASDDVLRPNDRVTFSSAGPRFDGALKPEIMAPGHDSFPRDGGVASALMLPDTNGSSTASCAYQFTQGTSFSAPTMTGATALVHQYFEEGRYMGSNPVTDPSAALMRAMLINAGERLTGANLGAGLYPSELQGWGEPNLSKVFDFGTGTRSLYVEDIAPADGFGSAASPVHQYTVNVTSSTEPLKITLCWTDEPGSLGTAKKLINDLHLTVTSPGGTTYLGSDFNTTTGESKTGGVANTLDIAESVIRLNPGLGMWTITVDPSVGNYSVNQGYALVATGALSVSAPDCNGNSVPDTDDISGGTSADCNGNGVPDECEPDCNNNGVADGCDLTAGTSTDCNGNSIPDSCDIASGLSTDCDGNGIPDSCQLASGAPDCNMNGQLDSCDLALGTSFDCDSTGIPDECESVTMQSFTSSPGSAINSALPPTVDTITVASALTINDLDVDIQLTHTWIGDLSISLASPTGTTLSLKSGSNTNVDNIDVTFDDAGVPYSEVDLPSGLTMQPQTSALAGVNGEDAQGTWTLTVTDGVAGDTGTLNLWRLNVTSGGAAPDCDGDGIPDGCEIDCNVNMVPDDCDISSGTSLDGNGNGIPDECEAADCNGNGIPDDQDISGGTETDCDLNAVPDSCQLDTDTDGLIDPCDTDDDNDTWSDSDEAACGTDPLSAASVPSDNDSDGSCDVVDPDDDNDGVADGLDSDPFNANLCRDADGDGCDDCSSGMDAPNNDGLDTDSDGQCNVGDPDDDNDTWSDTDEAACGTDPLSAASVPSDNDSDGSCDAVDPDDDNDGVADGLDSDPLNANLCRDADGDGCDDCSSGTDAPNNDGLDTDSDGQCNVGDPDDDNDGVADGLDSDPLNANLCRDADGDGCDDCSSGTDAPNNDGLDTDSDGQCDVGDTDDDNDTWSDTDEAACGTDPLSAASVPTDTDSDGSCDAVDPDDDNDGVADGLDSDPLNANLCRDADGDGCDDCSSGTDAPNNDGLDTDSDGQCNVGDPDDDNDTWSDTDESACGTDPLSAASVPSDNDSDGSCDVVDPDDDNDGVADGLDSDPFNANLCRDADGDGCDDCSSGTDAPNNDGLDTDSDGQCDVGDTDDDNDTWSDTDEAACGTDPLSAASVPTDTDSDGSCDAVDPDDDNDGVADGLDSDPLNANLCRDADGDGCDDCSSGTDAPNNDGLDTDSDGQCDVGDPDDDNDGVADGLDSDPLNANLCRDADGDGCDDCSSGTDAPNNDGLDTDSDGQCNVGDPDDDNDTWSDTDEAACGTDPLSAASVPTDTDSDGSCDAVDPDDDNDGVADGLDSDPLNANLCRDADGDGCDDCSSGTDAPNNDGLDTDSDGQCDVGDPDDDNDGVDDGLDSDPLNANLCRDVDGDGCDDCSSGTDDPANDGADGDGDGICDLGDACPGSDDSIDCNANGVPDGCDLSSGTSADSNSNGIPDECDGTFFVRGDKNVDGNYDISDPIFGLDVLFGSGVALCDLAMDANADDLVDISDIIYSLSAIFGTGPAPTAPFPACGLDPTPGPLTCNSFPACP